MLLRFSIAATILQKSRHVDAKLPQQGLNNCKMNASALKCIFPCTCFTCFHTLYSYTLCMHYLLDIHFMLNVHKHATQPTYATAIHTYAVYTYKQYMYNMHTYKTCFFSQNMHACVVCLPASQTNTTYMLHALHTVVYVTAPHPHKTSPTQDVNQQRGQ